MRSKFRLETLLTHKKRLEEVQQLRLAKIREEHHREHGLLQELRAHEDDQLSALAGTQTGVVDPHEIERRLTYIDHVQQTAAEQNQVVGLREGEVEENREHLVSVLKEKRVLEILKEKVRAQADEEARRLEAQFVDEISMTRFTRQQQQRETG